MSILPKIEKTKTNKQAVHLAIESSGHRRKRKKLISTEGRVEISLFIYCKSMDS